MNQAKLRIGAGFGLAAGVGQRGNLRNRRMLVRHEPHRMKRLDLTLALVNNETTRRVFDILSM
jgi:hypothetical protein